MEIERKEKEGVQVLNLDGQLVAGDDVVTVRSEIEKLVAEGKSRIVLNLENVEYIDSSGLGMMVMCYSATQKAGGDLKLLNLTRRNIELLVLTKLETVFEVFDDVQNAVNSFFPGREIQKFDILAFLQQRKPEEN